MKNVPMMERIVSHPDHADTVFSQATLDRLCDLEARLQKHGFSIKKITVNKRSVKARVASSDLSSAGTYQNLDDFICEETQRVNFMDQKKIA